MPTVPADRTIFYKGISYRPGQECPEEALASIQPQPKSPTRKPKSQKDEPINRSDSNGD